MMNFTTDAQRACYEKVSDYMTQLFGESAWASPDEPLFRVFQGSAFANLVVAPWSEDSAVIQAYSWVVTDVAPSAELSEYLLKENSTLLFGAFGMDDQNDIVFQYSLPGDTIDKGELRTLATIVADMADEYDDEIVGRFGGLRAKDRKPAPPPSSTPSTQT
jgi:Putative bacterial sensory transduction regulator